MADVLQCRTGSDQPCNYLVLEMLSIALLLSLLLFLGSSYWNVLSYVLVIRFKKLYSLILVVLYECLGPTEAFAWIQCFSHLKLPLVIFISGQREDDYYTHEFDLMSFLPLFICFMLPCFPWWCAWYTPCKVTCTFLCKQSLSWTLCTRSWTHVVSTTCMIRDNLDWCDWLGSWLIFKQKWS